MLLFYNNRVIILNINKLYCNYSNSFERSYIMSDTITLIVDLRTLVTFYAYRQLKDFRNRSITYKEIEEFKDILKEDLKKKNILLQITDYQYPSSIDVISDYPGMFSQTCFPQGIGFLIHASLTATEIYMTFLNHIYPRVIDYLDSSFETLKNPS